MSKKNKKNKGKKSTQNFEQLNPVVTREEAEVIESFINGIAGDEEAPIEDKKEKKEKSSKSLLEKIGKEEGMTELPEQPLKLAGNQGTVETSEEEPEAEAMDEAEEVVATLTINALMANIQVALKKHGLELNLELKDLAKLLKGCDNEMGAISTIVKLINTNKFDGKLAETVVDIKDAIVSWANALLILVPDAKEKLTEVIEKLNPITKDNYASVLESYGIMVDEIMKPEEKLAGNQGTVVSAEEFKAKSEQKLLEKNEQAPQKINTPVDTRRYVHEFETNEKLPYNVRIHNAAWYVVNGLGSQKYMDDLNRFRRAI